MTPACLSEVDQLGSCGLDLNYELLPLGAPLIYGIQVQQDHDWEPLRCEGLDHP